MMIPKLSSEEKQKVLRAYPDRIICMVYPKSDKDPIIDKHKYIVPQDIIFSNFIAIIRKRIKLTSSEALFFLSNDQMVPMNINMYEANQKFSHDDILYITYTKENVFG